MTRGGVCVSGLVLVCVFGLVLVCVFGLVLVCVCVVCVCGVHVECEPGSASVALVEERIWLGLRCS